MQKIYPRTNPTPFAALENSNAKAAPQIDEALLDFARQDTAHLRRVAESAAQGNLSREPEIQGTTDINSLVQRVASVSLDQLDDAIMELRQVRDFLDSEGKRIQREISGYLQLNQIAISSTKSIVNNIRHWKEAAHSAAHTPERGSSVTDSGDLEGSGPPPSKTAAIDVFSPPK
jgi:hypothetical protein